MVKVLCYKSEGRWFDPSWCHSSDRTTALGSTQPLTEISTRSISWGKGGRCVRLATLPPSCAVITKSDDLFPSRISTKTVHLLTGVPCTATFSAPLALRDLLVLLITEHNKLLSYFFTMTQQLLLASRSHSDTPHSIRLPWTADQPDEVTST